MINIQGVMTGGGPAPFTLGSSYGVLFLINFELVAMPVCRVKKRGKYSGMPCKAYMKGSMKAGALSEQLAVMVNPFSAATMNPKIPDGLSTLSAGLRLQVAGPLDATATNTIIHVLMLKRCNNRYTSKPDIYHNTPGNITHYNSLYIQQPWSL
jgi:hypothetical protein